MPFAARERLVIRDLKMTRAFLMEHLPDADLGRALVLAPPDLESAWQGWLEESLEVPVSIAGASHLPVAEARAVVPEGEWIHTAPLVGAALEEIE
jgi:hypothetical protein